MTRTPMAARDRIAIAILGPIVFIAAYIIGTIGKFMLTDLIGIS